MAWLSGWIYRKEILLSRESGAVENYQMKLLVGKSSLATGEDVDCGNHCLENFDDLRFTTEDGTSLLDYWIESINGSDSSALATVWIEFDEIDTTSTTFYMYYGNDDATSVSNGENTFPFFDDFDSESLDTDKWTASEGGTTISDSILRVYNISGSYCYGKVDFNVGYALRTKIKMQNAIQWAGQEIQEYAHTSNSYYLDIVTDGHVYNATGSSYNSIAHGLDMTTVYRIFDVVRTGGDPNRTRLYIDGVQKTNDTNAASGASTSNRHAVFNTYNNASYIWVDWVFYRKASNNDPVWESFGEEEASILAYSESSFITQGSYALKCMVSENAPITSYIQKTLSTPMNFSGIDMIYFDVAATRAGEILKASILNDTNVETYLIPNIIESNVYQTENWDISQVEDEDKNAINRIRFSPIDSTSEFTFYVDNFYYGGVPPQIPIIYNVSGTFSQDETITINGIGFGNKSQAAPLKWSNFNDGTSGVALNVVDSSWESKDVDKMLYTNTEKHSGDFSIYHNVPPGEEFARHTYEFTPSSEVFLSYWYRADMTGQTTNTKLPRINSTESAGGGGFYNGVGCTSAVAINAQTPQGPYVAYMHTGLQEEPVISFERRLDIPFSGWMRIDFYKKVSTAGIANGGVRIECVGRDIIEDMTLMTRAEDSTFLQNVILIGAMEGSDSTNHNYDYYIDDVYIDNTRARIEIGDASTWNNCTHREIQIPTSWSSNSISCTFNVGSFNPGDTVYVYVVDSNGVVNETGYEIQIAQVITEGYFVSKTGSDDTGDGSYDNPWLTLTYGASQLTTPGSILYVRSGTYDIDTPSQNRSCAVYPRANNCTIRSYPNETVVLRGNGGNGPGVFPTRGVIGTNTYSNVTIDGFTILGLAVIDGSDGGTIKNCDISVGGDGWPGTNQGGVVWLDECSNATIKNCNLHDNNKGSEAAEWGGNNSLIMGYRVGYGLVIENCEIHASYGSGITLKDDTNQATIRYNYIHSNNLGGIFLGNNDVARYDWSVRIYQNIFNNNNIKNRVPPDPETPDPQWGSIVPTIRMDHAFIYNNTFFNNNTADLLQWTGYSEVEFPVPWQFFNNISAQPVHNHLAWPWGGSYFSGTYLDYNCYYNDVSWLYKGSSYTTISTWRVLVDTILEGAETNSITSDPQFLNESETFMLPEDFKRTSYTLYGRGKGYSNIMGAYITGDEIIGLCNNPIENPYWTMVTPESSSFECTYIESLNDGIYCATYEVGLLKYNKDQGIWSQLISDSTSYMNGKLVNFNNEIYCVAEDSSANLVLLKFDGNNSWDQLGVLLEGQCGHLFVLNNTLYAIMNKGWESIYIIEWDENESEWVAAVNEYETENFSGSKQSTAIFNNDIYILGFNGDMLSWDATSSDFTLIENSNDFSDPVDVYFSNIVLNGNMLYAVGDYTDEFDEIFTYILKWNGEDSWTTISEQIPLGEENFVVSLFSCNYKITLILNNFNVLVLNNDEFKTFTTFPFEYFDLYSESYFMTVYENRIYSLCNYFKDEMTNDFGVLFRSNLLDN